MVTTTARRKKRQLGAGLGVDAQGGPVIDPTENVLTLVEAAVSRLDDLRASESRRIDDLREAKEKFHDSEVEHLRTMATLRAEHARDINEKESRRLDAIRQVDVLAVSTAADRAAAAISALAATTAANAENLRNALTTTATTIAKQTADTVTAITERLAALEKSSYEGKGRQGLSDPMLSELVSEMKSLRESRASGSGKSEGIGASWGFVVAAAVLVVALLTIGTSLFGNKAAPVAAPQVIYVPAPAQTAPPAPR